jgi:hypothetical protein
MQRKRGIENKLVGLRSLYCVEEVGKKGKSPLIPFLLFIVFLLDDKTDMLMHVSVLA